MNLPSLSLKWKIAAWYAALIVTVLALTSGVVIWRLDSIIYAQARERADSTMNHMLAVVNPAPFVLQDAGSSANPLQVLLNSDNLVFWSSPETSIEIDTTAGYPMVKSGNLGDERIPPVALDALHPVEYRDIKVRGGPALVEDRLVRIGATVVIVHVAESLAAVSHAIGEARQTVLILLAAAVFAVILLSIVLAGQATGPINELSRAMREIGFDRLDRRLAWPRRDELGELAKSFDDLLARLEASFSRERQFISDASHELKTPLTSINANAQMLLRWADQDERVRRDSLETIARESASLGEMVNGMLMLARADRGDEIPKEPVSLIEEAREVVRNAAQRAEAKGLELRFRCASDSAVVLADPKLVRQMIGNLVDNAIKFTDSGSVDVSVGREDGKGWLEVRDTGPGIAQGDLSRVFERFYRADRARSRSVPGTGLGLAIVRSVARAYGGDVAAHNIPKGGALFRITMPLLTLVLALLAAFPGAARAQDTLVSESPIVNIAVTSGSLSVRTWAKPIVRVVSRGHVTLQRFDPAQTTPRIPSEIHSWAVSLQTINGTAALPAETFVLPPLAGGDHDAITVESTAGARVFVPAGTALLIARAAHGTISVNGYHGVLIAHVQRGALMLDGFAGTAYAQADAGRIIALDASFDRLRARTAVGNLLFEGCRSNQIEVTAVHGTILYDDGVFAQGPAYFATGRGAVGIGVASGSATLNVHSATRNIVAALPRSTGVRRNDGSAVVTFGSGGPFVTAQASGAVFLYNGSLADHPRIDARFQSLLPNVTLP